MGSTKNKDGIVEYSEDTKGVVTFEFDIDELDNPTADSDIPAETTPQSSSYPKRA
ncbi:hypothetical protein NLN82_23300 [Citrobacter portucalensis]|uniref:hypothetical protein n=1 Tax=Citrobacter portucalensis TaxID=1639133 RepID=UPI00226B8AB6|nr:hypothetical protein [Citrobacter portucalensis]MCX9038955.1 hypothetical protein [Citrobacter portucalensis]